jgi:hypothetical protein
VFLAGPDRWPAWPFLPLVRRRPGQADECGLLYDARGAAGLTGLSATVFRANLFELPPTLTAFLALPRETHDTPEEVYDAGWRVD